MATYAFHLILNEGPEMKMMTDALNLYIKHCEDEGDKGNMTFDNMKRIAVQVQSLLYRNREKTSDNYFFEDNCKDK